MLDLDARGPRLKTQQRQYIPRLHILWLIRDLSTVPDWPSDVGWLSDYKNQSHLPSLTQTSNITQQRSLKQWKLPLYRCTSCAVNKIPSDSPPGPPFKQKVPYFYLSLLFYLFNTFVINILFNLFNTQFLSWSYWLNKNPELLI